MCDSPQSRSRNAVYRWAWEPTWFGVVGSLEGVVGSPSSRETGRAISPSPCPCSAEEEAGILCSGRTRNDRVGQDGEQELRDTISIWGNSRIHWAALTSRRLLVI